MPNEFQVVGPPGCGKTTFLTKSIAKNSREYGFQEVLVTSLTKTAAIELTSRIEGNENGMVVDPRNIGTLHAMCFRMLGYPEHADKHADDWNTRYPQYKRTTMQQADDVAVKEQASDIWGEIELLRHRLVPEAGWPAHTLRIYNLYREWKQQNELYDFTDMIEAGIDLSPGVSVIVGDEAQDYSALELKLLRSWGETAEKLIIAGDPDQVLYAWRGANPDLFKADYQGRKVLSQSYRVPKAVHAEAVKWIQQIKDREQFEYLPTSEEGAVKKLPLTFKHFNVDFLKQLEGSTMILASCGYMLNPLIQQLRTKGIPYHNPYRVAAGNWNPIKYSTVSRLLAFLKSQKTVDDMYRAIEFVRAEFLQEGVKKRLKMYEERGTVISEFDEFNLWSEKGLELEGALDWFDALTKSKQKSWAFLRKVVEKQGVEALQERPKIILGSIHSVKGGQADNVIIFPDLSYKASQGINTKEGRESMIRAFYVGMTRAKKALYLCSSASGSKAAWF